MSHWKRYPIVSTEFLSHPCLHNQIYSSPSSCLPGSNIPGARSIFRASLEFYTQYHINIVWKSDISCQDNQECVMSHIHGIFLPNILINLLPQDIIPSIHGLNILRVRINQFPWGSIPRVCFNVTFDKIELFIILGGNK